MPVNINAARENIRLKEAGRQAVLDGKFTAATRDAEAVIRMIIERYNPTRIYQWGSLLDRSRFEDYSDIDIAVMGLGPAEVFFALCRDAEKMTAFPLDIVEMEKIEPVYADSIVQKGRLRYERK